MFLQKQRLESVSCWTIPNYPKSCELCRYQPESETAATHISVNVDHAAKDFAAYSTMHHSGDYLSHRLFPLSCSPFGLPVWEPAKESSAPGPEKLAGYFSGKLPSYLHDLNRELIEGDKNLLLSPILKGCSTQRSVTKTIPQCFRLLEVNPTELRTILF